MSAPIGVRFICTPPTGGRKLIPRPRLVNRSPSRSRTSSSSAPAAFAAVLSAVALSGAALSAAQIAPAAGSKSNTAHNFLIAASPSCQMDRSLPQNPRIVAADSPNFNDLTPNLPLNLLPLLPAQTLRLIFRQQIIPPQRLPILLLRKILIPQLFQRLRISQSQLHIPRRQPQRTLIRPHHLRPIRLRLPQLMLRLERKIFSRPRISCDGRIDHLPH